MTTTIDDMPSGRKIKNIKVDISFDDDNTIVQNIISPDSLSPVNFSKDEIQEDTKIMEKTTGVEESPVISDITQNTNTLNMPITPNIDNRPPNSAGINDEEF